MSSDLDLGPTSPPPASATSSQPPPDSGSLNPEPQVGLQFPSEDAARLFYEQYAQRTGFVMRVMGCRKSEVDGRILARRLGCNKEGFCVPNSGNSSSKRQKKSTREGCKAMILVKADNSSSNDDNNKSGGGGKWIVSKFVRDHNHPLVVAPREIRHSMDIRDRKIQELNTEIRNKKRLCALYQDQLTTFMKEVEEHGNQLSKKVQTVVKNLQRFGPLEEDLLQHR